MSVGDTIDMNMKDGTKLTWIVRDVAANGDVTFGATTSIGSMKMLETDPGYAISYKDTDLRAYLNSTFYQNIPDIVRSEIKQKQYQSAKSTGYDGSKVTYVYESLSDYVWVPSYCNIYGEPPADGYVSYAIFRNGDTRMAWYSNNAMDTLYHWLSDIGGSYKTTGDFIKNAGTSKNGTAGNRQQAVDTAYGTVPYFIIGG